MTLRVPRDRSRRRPQRANLLKNSILDSTRESRRDRAPIVQRPARPLVDGGSTGSQLKVFHRAAEPAQELDFAISTFEPDEFLLLSAESLSHLSARRTERVAGRSLRVAVPVAFLVWPIRLGALLDRLGDRAARVAGDGHSNGDLDIEPGRICPPPRLLADDLGQVSAINGGRRHGLPVRSRSTDGRVGFCRRPESLPFIRDRSLEIRIRDFEAVLGGQLDTGAPELFVTANGDGSPLLRAQLKRGQHAFAASGVVNVDRLPPIGKRWRTARSGQMVVDFRAVEHGAERANVARRGFLERRPL